MIGRIQNFIYYNGKKLTKVLTGVRWGAYVQNREDVHIGDGVFLGPGACVLSANHDLWDPSKHQEHQETYVRDHCWIGANAVILPGVTLGPHTVVGAGAVVTKSFPDGHCVLVGNPARKLRDLDGPE